VTPDFSGYNATVGCCARWRHVDEPDMHSKDDMIKDRQEDDDDDATCDEDDDDDDDDDSTCHHEGDRASLEHIHTRTLEA
jgi:hypothetical protein